MRKTMAGLVGMFLILVLAVNIVVHSEARGDRPNDDLDRTPPGELIALSSDADATNQQVVVIDPRTRVMSVYHVSRATGEVALKSVRNIRWDLQMDEFNGASPSPREIKVMLEARRR